MEKIKYKLWVSIQDNMGRNAMFGEYIKDEQMC